MAMLEEGTSLLLNSQNADGGWGAVAGRHSNTEATALALLALQSNAVAVDGPRIHKAKQWLAERQNPDGSWPLNGATKGPSWSTALAMIALSESADHQDQVMKAGNWALEQEGSKPGILAKLIRALSFQKKVVHLNEDLIGWSWTPNTFSWVEPTSYFLLALKKIKSRLPSKTVQERVEQGELMIYDRMCEQGGWNYGNASVYGDGLWPYPDVTAIALIALQDRRERKENQLSLRVLVDLAQSTDSGLALGWSLICLSVYGQDGSALKKRLKERFAKTKFLGETKAVALGILAGGNGAWYFRI
jgi:Prenyltransferase and squalene oxidase repeat